MSEEHHEAIHPEALRRARRRQKKTQEQLAEALGCTKDTVSRWERGKTQRVRSHLREPLCEVLRTDWSSLCKPPDQHADSPQDSTRRTRVKVSIGKHVQTALHLVAARYDVRPGQVLDVAPLLFLIVAELSLLERRRRLEEINTALHDAEEILLRNRAHLGGVITANNTAAEDQLIQEEESLDKRDVFGRSIKYEYWEEGNEGPFVHFVNGLAKSLPKDAVRSIDSFDSDMIETYQIAEDTLRECTGISENDEQGKDLLHYIRCGFIDFAECVRMRRDGDEASYRQWLSQELGRSKEQARRDLREMFGFDVSAGLTASEAATPGERSET